MVARPLRHPRRSRRFTPGSIASERKIETSNNKSRFVKRWNEYRVATITRKPTQKMDTAFTSQRVDPTFSSAGDGMTEAYAGTMWAW